jgi:hypothetical protein
VDSILYNADPVLPFATNVSYSIDGIERGNFVRTFKGANLDVFNFNQSLFKVEWLTKSQHTLRVDTLGDSILLV